MNSLRINRAILSHPGEKAKSGDGQMQGFAGVVSSFLAEGMPTTNDANVVTNDTKHAALQRTSCRLRTAVPDAPVCALAGSLFPTLKLGQITRFLGQFTLSVTREAGGREEGGGLLREHRGPFWRSGISRAWRNLRGVPGIGVQIRQAALL